MKVSGSEYGVMPTLVAAAALVPFSSTSITALCRTWTQIKRKCLTFFFFFFKSVHFYYKMRKNYGNLHESMFCEEQASQLTLVNMSLFLKQCLFSNQWNIWSVFMCLCWSIKSKYYYKLIYSSVVIFYLLLKVWAAILICSAWSWGDFPDFPSRISKFAFS